MTKPDEGLVESRRRPWTPTELESEKREIAGYYGNSQTEFTSTSTYSGSRWASNSAFAGPHAPDPNTNDGSSTAWPTDSTALPQPGQGLGPSIMLPVPNRGRRNPYFDLESLAVLPSQRRALASATGSALASPISPLTPSIPFAKNEITSSPRMRDVALASGSAAVFLSQSTTSSPTPAGTVGVPPQVRTAKHESLMYVSGTATRLVDILVINPTSSGEVTRMCLQSLAATIPSGVNVHGFTAPQPAPTANECQLDAVISTAVCLPSILAIARKYDGFLVLSFESQALVDALREELTQPVLSTMETVLHASLMIGPRLGVITTNSSSAIAISDAVRAEYGLRSHLVVTEVIEMNRSQLEFAHRGDVVGRLTRGIKRLRQRGADCVCLGNTAMALACRDELELAIAAHGDKLSIVDGVGVGVQFLVGLVCAKSTKIKSGSYESAGMSTPDR